VISIHRSFLAILSFVTSSVAVLATQPAFAQDSATAYRDLATGHSYLGVEAGVDWSTYLGSKNFMFDYLTVDARGLPDFHTYLPFGSLGSGVGVLGGMKIGIAASHFLDIETKLRYMTNHTSAEYYQENIILDVFKKNPHPTANATSTYSLTTQSISLAILGHVRLTDRFYAAAGLGYSNMTTANFSAHQQLSGGTGYYRQSTHNNSFQYSIDEPTASFLDNVENVRTDALAGVGGTYRLGASNLLLDAELLVSIPFSQWLKTSAQVFLDSQASHFEQPQIKFPHMWYASLTVGLRFPFAALPPIPPPPPPPPPVKDTQLSVTIEAKPDTAGTMLSGTVTSSVNGAPIPAVLTTVDLTTNQVVSRDSTDASGNYHIRVSKPGKYSVTADADGFLFGTAYFEIDSAGRILSNHEHIKLSPANGRTRLLTFFEFNKAELQESSSPELNRVVELMKAVPAMRVEIAGYTDSVGTRAYNMDLSLRRANAVRDFVVQHGISPDRVIAKGYGTDSPIATNSTEEGRAENRRVEFVVITR
jgi:outer membrane protein OmpA-like peptidoglycan-associated protein